MECNLVTFEAIVEQFGELFLSVLHFSGFRNLPAFSRGFIA